MPAVAAAGAVSRKLMKSVAPVGEVDRHEPAAADIAAARLDHGERIADRDRGVDRIAAGGENAGADRGGDVLRGHHHAVLGLDRLWRSRRRFAGRYGDQRQCRRGNDAPDHLRRARVSRS